MAVCGLQTRAGLGALRPLFKNYVGLLMLLLAILDGLPSSFYQPVQALSVTCNVTDEESIHRCLEQADSSIEMFLPPFEILLSKPMNVSVPLKLFGHNVVKEDDTAELMSQLSCRENNTRLIELTGSRTLTIYQVWLRNCEGPGLVILPGLTASVLIENSWFTNFSRKLEPGRVNTSDPGSPAPIVHGSTAALAINATDFVGSFQMRQTKLTGNMFLRAPSADELPHQMRHQRRQMLQEQQTQQGLSSGKQGHNMSSTPSAASDDGRGRHIGDIMEGGPQGAYNTTQHIPQDQRRKLQSSESLQSFLGEALRDDSVLLLPQADQLHPQLQEGPWADDLEAVASFHCRTGIGGLDNDTSQPHCSIELQNVTIRNNTGVATSGVYVLCDGISCNVSIKGCTVQDNSLLWQNAIVPTDGDQPGPTCWFARPGPGLKLFKKMMPWLTYTYPITYDWLARNTQSLVNWLYTSNNSTPPEDYTWDKSCKDYASPLSTNDSVAVNSPPLGDTSDYSDSSGPSPNDSSDSIGHLAADLAANLPNVTGRTLGVIVVHLRNSLCVDAQGKAMAIVTITGGIMSGNDGAAIMGTTVDWARITKDCPVADGVTRHSMDVKLQGLHVHRHLSGMPAVWLRWPRSAIAKNCTVTESTGALWLDQVRDSASIDTCTFRGNYFPEQKWLYYWGFMAITPNEDPAISDYPKGMGAGSFQVVLIQMTPLGQLTNNVTIRNSVFEDNPSYVMGTLYIAGSDRFVRDKNNLPGHTVVEITHSNFTQNYCRSWAAVPIDLKLINYLGKRSPDNNQFTCSTGERPVYVFATYSVTINECRFEGNLNGGAYIETVTAFLLERSTFANNIQTYSLMKNGADKGNGGGGLTAISIGTGGVRVHNCAFLSNESPSGGGAVMLRQYYFADFSNSVFENNSAAISDGGAIWMMSAEMNDEDDSTQDGFNQLANCIFRGNMAGRRGGAITAIKAPAGSTLFISGCLFEGNKAMVLPKITAVNPLLRADEAGGGGVYVQSAKGVEIKNTTFLNNRVLQHAGGALRVVDVETLMALSDPNNISIRFEGNTAIMGGALAVSRFRVALLDSCFFGGNNVTDVWVWPDTSSEPQANNVSLHGSLKSLKPGYGGAIFAEDCASAFMITGYSIFIENVAYVGGAVAVLSCTSFEIQTFYFRLNATTDPIEIPYSLQIPQHVAQSAVAPLQLVESVLIKSSIHGNSAAVNYTTLFAHNSALIGGAVFTMECDSATFSAEADYRTSLGRMPPLLVFYNNTANGGGAMYLLGSVDKVIISGALMIANHARHSAPPGTNHQHGDLFGTIMGLPCFGGGGGSICMVGYQGGLYEVEESAIVVNEADLDGGGIYVAAEGGDCLDVRECYTFKLSYVALTGNVAYKGRGGGIFWRDAGSVKISTCNMAYSGGPFYDMIPDVGKNLTLLPTGRKPPSTLIGNLDRDKRRVLIEYLDVTSSNSNNDSEPWYGVPFESLPCSDWFGNKAAANGDDIGSTPAFLLVKTFEAFYPSNTELDLDVSVHDWLGYNCSGDETVQPVVIVQADSPNVFGTSNILASNGTAHFVSLKLRAPEGLYTVNFTGRIRNPDRDLIPTHMEVYVRPCGINEFLSPGSHDECVACRPGSYNFNKSADICEECPKNADCRFPNNGQGFMVPKPGMWHKHVFDYQVLSCPNSRSCKRPNRSHILGALQVQVSKVARSVQYDMLTKQHFIDGRSNSNVSNSSSTQGMLDASTSWGLLQVYCAIPAEILSNYTSTQCADGYHGTLCAQCQKGYGWVNVATCIKCPSKELSGLYYTLATLLTMATLTLTVYTSLGPRKHQNSAACGIGVAKRVHLRTGGSILSPTDSIHRRHECVQVVLDKDVDDDTERIGISSDSLRDLCGDKMTANFTTPAPAPGTASLGADADSDPRCNGLNSNEAPAIVSNSAECADEIVELKPASVSSDSVAIGDGRILPVHKADCTANSDPQPRSLQQLPSGALMLHETAQQQQHQKEVTKSNSEMLSHARLSTIIRIAVAYLQVLALLGALPMDLEDVIDVFFGLSSQATSYPGALVSLDCSLPSDLSISNAMARVLVTVLAPLYTFIAFVIISLVLGTVKHYMKRDGIHITNPVQVLRLVLYDNARREFLVAFSTIMFFFYPSVSQALFSIFNCYDVTSFDIQTFKLITKSIWQLDFDVECYEGSHLGLVIGLGVLGLLLIGLGWPLLSALIVLRSLYVKTSSSNGTTSVYILNIDEVSDYKARWVWWESVILLRQLAIAAVVTFIADRSSLSVQLLIIFFILVAASAIQTVVRPYHSKQMGILSLLALYTLMATVYLLVYLTEIDDDDTSGKAAVSIIIVILNSILIIAFIWSFIQTYWYGLLRSSGLDGLDPEVRRSLTFVEARNRILTHLDTISASKRLYINRRHTSSSIEQRLHKVKRSGVASSKAAVILLGNSLSGPVDALVNKVLHTQSSARSAPC